MADGPGQHAAPALRASDADRERVADLLSDHAAAGRLTLEELAERVDTALGARTQAELDALLADLPRGGVAPPTPAQPARRPSERTIAIMSGAEKKGRWRAEGKHVAIAVMGGIELDLRRAEIVGHELEITAFAFWGGIEILVPEGLSVEVSALPLMGGVDAKLPDSEPLPGSPRVRIRAIAIMGGIEVKVKARRRPALGEQPPAPPIPPIPPPLPPSLPR